MKKGRWVSGIILIVVWALVVALPYAFGIVVEKRYKQVLKEFSISSGIRIHLTRYDRGWWRSFAEVAVDVNPQTTKGSARWMNNPALRRFVFNERIAHGPLVFIHTTPKLVQAVIRTRLVLTPAQRAFLGRPKGAAPLLVGQSMVLLNGSLRGEMVGPAFVSEQQGLFVDWKGMRIVSSVSADMKHLRSTLDFAGMDYKKGDVGLHLAGMHWGYQGQQHTSGLWVGGGEFDLENLMFLLKGQSHLQINALVSHVQAKVVGEHLNSVSDARIAAIKIDDVVFGPGEVNITTSDLDVKAIAHLKQQLSQVQQVKTPTSEQTQALFQAMMALLDKGAALNLNKLSLKTPWGMVSAKGMVLLPEQQPPSALGVFGLLQRVQASLTMRIPIALSEQLAQGYFSSQKLSTTADGKQQAAQFFSDALKQKLLIKAANDYTLDVVYRGGRLVVNGEPLRFPTQEQPVAASAAPKGH